LEIFPIATTKNKGALLNGKLKKALGKSNGRYLFDLSIGNPFCLNKK